MTPEGPTALVRDLVAEIRSRGPIPFARFMEVALYHPTEGYYTRGLGGGGGRDYVTSSGLHRAFGALIARQAEEMWRLAGGPDRFRFVEFGPGEGLFACDLLRAAAGAPEFFRHLDYVLVEKSPGLRARQRARIETHVAGPEGAPPPVRWSTLEDLEGSGIGTGCLFANEVLDAFPVHRIVGGGAGLLEVHVAEAPGGGLEERRLPLADPVVAACLERAGVRPEAGQEVDLCPAAEEFVRRAGGILDRGWLVLVDYGHLAQDLYHPARRRGTLLAYHRHRVNEDFLARPGEQDLTAHVDFTAAMRAAGEAGLRVLGLTSQARFLLALGALDLMEGAGPAEREALKDLVLPDRMGGTFRVLVLARGDVPGTLRGLSAPWRSPGAGDPIPARHAEGGAARA